LALTLLFAAFMARNVVSHGNLFLENLQAQLKLERQTEIISLLLKEFQENASDWLWQTDAEGRLSYVPERFVEVAQIPLPLLRGVSFSDVLEMLCPGDAITTSNIAALMKRREPLDEMSVRVVAAGETRIWSLTAKPNHDGDGQFLGYRGFGRDMTERWRASSIRNNGRRYPRSASPAIICSGCSTTSWTFRSWKPAVSNSRRSIFRRRRLSMPSSR
jgi:PAS domain-containing protein